MIRDLGGEPAVTFVEEDDEYLAVVRLDEAGDPRVFLSDQRALFTSRVAGRLFADALPAVTELDPDEDTEGGLSHATPIGDLELLSDLGTGPDALIEIIMARGVLPSDAVATLTERAGAGDILDEVGG
jgi:putative tRNA adenosine deaminase-associated protein